MDRSLRKLALKMTEPNFDFISIPDFLLAEINQHIDHLRAELDRADASALVEPLRRLSRIRGNLAFDLMSSIAWAAEAICRTAADANRELNPVELRSIRNAIESIECARQTASLSIAV